jgi:hypothetical protein
VSQQETRDMNAGMPTRSINKFELAERISLALALIAGVLWALVTGAAGLY